MPHPDLEFALDAANDLIEEMGAEFPITLPDATIIPCIPDEQPANIERKFGYGALDGETGRASLFYVRMQDRGHFADGDKFRFDDTPFRVKRAIQDLKVQIVVLAVVDGL